MPEALGELTQSLPGVENGQLSTLWTDLCAAMLASVMSRVIDSALPLVPTLVAGGVLVGLHWLLTNLAYHTTWFGGPVKGHRVFLIKGTGCWKTTCTRRPSPRRT